MSVLEIELLETLHSTGAMTGTRIRVRYVLYIPPPDSTVSITAGQDKLFETATPFAEVEITPVSPGEETRAAVLYFEPVSSFISASTGRPSKIKRRTMFPELEYGYIDLSKSVRERISSGRAGCRWCEPVTTRTPPQHQKYHEHSLSRHSTS